MYYRKTKGLFDPKSTEPYRISRSKIESYVQCPRCFYMEARLGYGRPSIPSFNLNNAVDVLLKNEFDLLRKDGLKHELMEQYGIDAVPFQHDDLNKWRGEVERFVGALYIHPETNLEINGLVDDIWVDSDGELLMVDYKSTSTDKEVTLDEDYKKSYKRQIEIYQWIFEKLGFKVSNIGYFVYANAKKNLPKFDGKLEFEMKILPHEGDTTWIDKTLSDIKKCLMSDNIPSAHPDCEYCDYKKSSVLAVTQWKKKHS